MNMNIINLGYYNIGGGYEGECYQRFLAFVASSPNHEDKEKAEAAIIFIISAMTMIVSIIQCVTKKETAPQPKQRQC